VVVITPTNATTSGDHAVGFAVVTGVGVS
jgi:hypothetical protein